MATCPADLCTALRRGRSSRHGAECTGRQGQLRRPLGPERVWSGPSFSTAQHWPAWCSSHSILPCEPRNSNTRLTHSRASLLLYADTNRDDDLAEVVASVAPGLPNLVCISLSEQERWQAAEASSAVLRAAPTDPDEAVMLQYTSGTTGRPKGVLLKHRSLVNVAKLTLEAVGVEAGSVCLNPLPMFHTAGCVIATLGPVVDWRDGGSRRDASGPPRCWRRYAASTCPSCSTCRRSSARCWNVTQRVHPCADVEGDHGRRVERPGER